MLEILTECSSIIKIEKREKISKEMEVFYNPIMRLNRDISILLLNSINKKDIQICLPLSGSGIRGIRFLKELDKGKIKSICINDYDPKAFRSILNNLRLNRVNKFQIFNNSKNNKINSGIKIKLYNEDANSLLLNSKGFDYIDIDPFGTSNFFLDSAIKRISREGILAVTNTDTAALSGTYPKACVRKYWSKPKRDWMMHETGLRILIRKVQLIGMQYDKALFPVFSYFMDHYFRIFFKCIKGKKKCDEIAKQHLMFNDAGPMWAGSLWDRKLVVKMNKNYRESSILNCGDEGSRALEKFHNTIKNESKINAVGFFDIHSISKKTKIKVIQKNDVILKKLKKNGFKASITHFLGTGIRSNAPYDKLLKVLRE